MRQISLVHTSQQPSPAMPPAMLQTAFSLIQWQVELIPPGWRWLVSAVITKTVAHHLRAQRCMARKHAEVPDLVYPRRWHCGTQPNQQVIGRQDERAAAILPRVLDPEWTSPPCGRVHGGLRPERSEGAPAGRSEREL